LRTGAKINRRELPFKAAVKELYRRDVEPMTTG
jgi:hypothetical protein